VKYVPWIAALVLGVLLGRALFPDTRTVTEIVRLPSNTDTVTVTVTELDSVEVVRFRDRPVFSTDTLVLRDTVWRAADTVPAMPLTWHLTRLQAGHSLDTPTYVSGVAYRYGDVLERIETFESYPTTLGPITDIIADSAGIHVNFGSWPTPPKPCAFWCRAQYAIGGLAAGVIVWEVAR
jgi:hypothetical protein